MTLKEARELLPDILIDYLYQVGKDDENRRDRIAAARRLIEQARPGTLKRLSI